jgi:hypothetical protein
VLGEGNRHTTWTNAAFRAYAGYMETSAFRAALQEIEAETRSGQRLVMLCAETLWWRCHRRLIADALLLDGFEVRHLIDGAPGQPHRLHPAVRRGEAGELVYDGLPVDSGGHRKVGSSRSGSPDSAVRHHLTSPGDGHHPVELCRHVWSAEVGLHSVTRVLDRRSIGAPRRTCLNG